MEKSVQNSPKNALTSAIVNPLAFAFEGRNIRTVQINDEPWFVAKDIAEALEYSWGGSRIAHIPDEWRGVASVVTPSGTQEMAVLSEQGMYFFLGRSDKPKALPFQMWLAKDVVPSIRRTGGYTQVKPTEKAAADTLEVMLRVANLLAVPLHMAQVESVKYVRLNSGVDFTPMLLLAPAQQNLDPEDEMLEPTEIGKHFMMSAIKVNRMLEAAGLQVKGPTRWEATPEAEGLWSLHQWVEGNKSGTNLKWRLSAIKEVFATEPA